MVVLVKMEVCFGWHEKRLWMCDATRMLMGEDGVAR